MTHLKKHIKKGMLEIEIDGVIDCEKPDYIRVSFQPDFITITTHYPNDVAEIRVFEYIEKTTFGNSDTMPKEDKWLKAPKKIKRKVMAETKKF